MKKLCAVFVVLMLVIVAVMPCLAEEAVPYASKEINSTTVSLLPSKAIFYGVSLTSPTYSVKVNYCNLYKQSNLGVWEFVCAMPKAIPPVQTGDLDKAYDISSYITSSGKYQVRVSITSGSTTVYHSPSRTY